MRRRARGRSRSGTADKGLDGSGRLSHTLCVVARPSSREGGGAVERGERETRYDLLDESGSRRACEVRRLWLARSLATCSLVHTRGERAREDFRYGGARPFLRLARASDGGSKRSPSAKGATAASTSVPGTFFFLLCFADCPPTPPVSGASLVVPHRGTRLRSLVPRGRSAPKLLFPSRRQSESAGQEEQAQKKTPVARS